MDQAGKKHITLSRISLSVTLLITGLSLGLIIFLPNSDEPQTPTIAQIDPAPAPQAVIRPAVKPAPKPQASTPLKQPAAAKAKPAHTEIAKPNNDFVIQGLLSTGGEPWAAKMIMVKILWLKNKNQQQFILGAETSRVQATPEGFAYRIRLKQLPTAYLNWNGGVEGNVGRIVAFVDNKRDGRLSLKQDKIIAVSKELIRYRTGRFDRQSLNEVQQRNIKQAGKGYVIIRNMQVAQDRLDWKVVAHRSPARLDLSAAETGLPNMYNTFMKLQ